MELEGTRWVLAALGDDDNSLVSALPGVEATATFENGRVSGKSSCNQYGAAYTLDGHYLSITGHMMSTMMACPEPIMRQEQQFQAALQTAATYAINDSILTIADAAGEPALIMKAEIPATLIGTNWVARNYNNGKQAVVSILAGSTLTAQFSADGKITGSSGCNNYTAGYTLDGKRISIGPAAGTRKMCAKPEGVMEQESLYLTALPTAASYRIEGDLLELRTDAGSLVASYTAQ